MARGRQQRHPPHKSSMIADGAAESSGLGDRTFAESSIGGDSKSRSRNRSSPKRERTEEGLRTVIGNAGGGL